MKNQEEVWLPVKGYEGIYEISSHGNARSLNRTVLNTGTGLMMSLKGKSLSLKPDTQGYHRINLRKDGKSKTAKIHQLVAIAFLNHTPCGYQLVVDHIDEDKTNNNISNLQVILHRENLSRSRKGKKGKYPGITWIEKDKKWKASIEINGKNNYLGMFLKEKDAGLAYLEAVNKLKNGNDI